MDQEQRCSKAAVSRRGFLRGVAGAAAGVSISGARKPVSAAEGTRMRIHLFSKHLQWLDYAGMAETAAALGFDGLDLTVRPKGHVEPERVEEDLPKAVAAIAKAGLKFEMMVTGITDPRDRHTGPILQTASKLGCRYYRTGALYYDRRKGIPEQLAALKPIFRDLAALNQQYGLHGAYQNHAGSRNVGAPVWDIWHLVRDLDPRWMGCQFDIRHATVEGGTVWPIHFRLIAPHVRTIIAKDFQWKKGEKGWRTENCPLGQGMVDFSTYFTMVKEAGIPGPISVHVEYPLGGANHGARTITIPKEQVLDAMRRDLAVLKRWLGAAGL
jgi:sugar phosphate isomerase/epimerase